ncbi:MAG: hypothetical protein AAFO84_12025, partial [Cyanobacteria bacterium J06598_1]
EEVKQIDSEATNPEPGESGNIGVWQRRTIRPNSEQPDGQSERPSAIDPDASEPAAPPANPSTAEVLAGEDYIMVPAGKMPSPSNPDEEIEVWVMQRSDAAMPVPIEANDAREPVGVGERE